MTQKPDYERGWQDGVRAAVTWLHNRADEMNDPHAKGLYNSAAFNLGSDASLKVQRKRRERRSRPMTGLWVTLSPGQQKAALAYDGPENFGPGLPPTVGT